MKCFDSDILVAILRGDRTALPFVEKQDAEGRPSTTSINAFEILFGAKKSRNHQNIEATRTLLAKLAIFPFDENASEIASDVFSTLSNTGQQIELPDLLSASIALAHGATFVTRNTKHFSRIKELTLEQW